MILDNCAFVCYFRNNVQKIDATTHKDVLFCLWKGRKDVKRCTLFPISAIFVDCMLLLLLSRLNLQSSGGSGSIFRGLSSSLHEITQPLQRR